MLKKTFGYLIGCLLLFFSFFIKADLLTASLSYHGGEYQQAYKAFNQLARLGNKDAIYNIAVMYLHGQGRSKDLAQAYAWFSLAADFGLEPARSAAKLIEQQYKEPDKLLAAYKKLTQRFNHQQYRQTLMPDFNSQADVTAPERIHVLEAKYPKQAKAQGLEGWVWLEFDVDASGVVTDVDIVDSYPDKTFNRSIYNAIRRWRFEPLKQGNQSVANPNQWWLYHFTTFKGKRYQASFSRQQKQYQQEINHLIERAEQGSALVQYHIANWMMGEEHNATRLLKFHWPQGDVGDALLLDSAVNGYALAQYRLGGRLLRGDGVKQDRQKGLNWVRHAAEQQLAFAQYRMAVELLHSDPALAKQWLLKAAMQQHFRAMRDLVDLLIEQQDFTQAKVWLQKAMKVDDEHPQLWAAKFQLLSIDGDAQAAKVALANVKEFAQDRGWPWSHLVNKN